MAFETSKTGIHSPQGVPLALGVSLFFLNERNYISQLLPVGQTVQISNECSSTGYSVAGWYARDYGGGIVN